MHLLKCALFLSVAAACLPASAYAQKSPSETCPRAPIGSVVTDPENLRSENGVLKVSLAFKSYLSPAGETRFCYIYEKDGAQAPTLRLKPGDTLILTLKNALASSPKNSMGAMGMSISAPCASATITSSSTNLHFHGIAVPPICHQDDVLKTVVDPGDLPFEYRFQIPADEPPGLYWYHPHIHGINKSQVVGGASGALIVEGIERANSQLAGLPERVFVIRDQDLVNPNAQPASSSSVPAIVLRDAEGDILNTGTGGGKPAMDLSVNFVPVPFPDYRPAIIETKPDERKFWRVLNASALTYLDLQVLIGNQQQQLGVVSLDGVPINENGAAPNKILWQSHIALPPAGRAEFILKGLPAGTNATLVTRTVDTGPLGENDPTRPLAGNSRHRLRHEFTTEARRVSRTTCAQPRDLARRRETNPRKETLFLRAAARSERSEKSHRFFHHSRRPNSARLRHTLHNPKHRGSSRRRGRLDHRESLAGIARISHPPDPFHARPVEWRSR